MAVEKVQVWASAKFWLGIVIVLWVVTAGVAGYFYAWSRAMTTAGTAQTTLQLPSPLGEISTGLDRAKRDLARPRMAVIENAIKSFEFDCGRPPDESEGGLEALIIAPADLEGKWNGPYLKQSQILDPWGNEYRYICNSQADVRSFDLICLGADGQEGGEGENADIVKE